MATDNLSIPAPAVQYRDVPGGNRKRYRVGDDGSAWSSGDDGKTWTQIKPTALTSGHLRIYLGRGNENMRFMHRLVLEAFVGPPPEPGMFACHFNDDPGDNRLENLRWGSRQDNVDDAVRNGRIKKGHNAAAAKLTEAQVLEVVAMRQDGTRQLDIARHFGITLAHVQAILYGISWSHLTGIPPKKIGKPAGKREKLTDQDVLIILSRCRTGEDQSAIAQDYGVCLQTVNGINRGFTWNRVTGLPKKRLA